MKPGATEHPKVYELARVLKCSRAQACGHLEMLWHFTAKFAPAGDVGRWPDQALARACDWEGDPTEFVNALHTVRFLDAHCAHRFVIHDWHEHAQDSVHMALARAGKRFANDSIPKLGRLTEKERETARRALSVRTTNALPSPPLPSPSSPSHPIPSPPPPCRPPLAVEAAPEAGERASGGVNSQEDRDAIRYFLRDAHNTAAVIAIARDTPKRVVQFAIWLVFGSTRKKSGDGWGLVLSKLTTGEAQEIWANAPEKRREFEMVLSNGRKSA